MNLIIIRGLPGSGKTTLASVIATDNNFEHYEADMFFIDVNGKYKFDRSNIRQAHEWCQTSTKHALAEGKSVIVSNTFTTVKELKPYFQMAKTVGITPTVYICQNDWGSIHGVPEDTMIAMKSRFQYDISSLFKEFE
jgi:predicted kinase